MVESLDPSFVVDRDSHSLLLPSLSFYLSLSSTVSERLSWSLDRQPALYFFSAWLTRLDRERSISAIWSSASPVAGIPQAARTPVSLRFTPSTSTPVLRNRGSETQPRQNQQQQPRQQQQRQEQQPCCGCSLSSVGSVIGPESSTVGPLPRPVLL